MSNDWRELKRELKWWSEDDIIPGDAQAEMLNALTRINMLEEALENNRITKEQDLLYQRQLEEQVAERYNLTPVFMEDKVDGSDVAAIPWREVLVALRQVEKATYKAAAEVLATEERNQWHRDEKNLPGAQIVAQRMQLVRKVLEGRATQ